MSIMVGGGCVCLRKCFSLNHARFKTRRVAYTNFILQLLGAPVITPGSYSRVIGDYNPENEFEISVREGDVVFILEHCRKKGYLIERSTNNSSPYVEGWVPGFVLSPEQPFNWKRNASWTFKFRKPSHDVKNKDVSRKLSLDFASSGGATSICDICLKMLDVHVDSSCKKVGPQKKSKEPSFAKPLNSLRVKNGEIAVLACKLSDHKSCVSVLWKNPKQLDIIRSDRYFTCQHPNGTLTLEILGCKPSDSGEYTCLALCEDGISSTKGHLAVSG